MSTRGWSSRHLKTVGQDETLWTPTEAANLLGPPYRTPAQIRQLITMAQIPPAGKRRTTPHGQPGRYARVYRADDLIDAFERICIHYAAHASQDTG